MVYNSYQVSTRELLGLGYIRKRSQLPMEITQVNNQTNNQIQYPQLNLLYIFSNSFSVLFIYILFLFFLFLFLSAVQEPCITANNCNCVLRLRYNVTSSQLGSFADQMSKPSPDWNSNGVNSPITQVYIQRYLDI